MGTAVIASLVRALDAAALQQRVIANNVANVDTPGFKRSEVDFAAGLEQLAGKQVVMERTHPRHLPEPATGTGVVVSRDASTSQRVDGNNVDLGRELVELTMNSLFYQTVVQELNGRLAQLRYAINEGRR